MIWNYLVRDLVPNLESYVQCHQEQGWPPDIPHRHINTAMVQMISGGDCLHGNVERLQRAFDEEIKFKNLI